MNTYLIIGTVIVVFALIAYSIGILTEQNQHLITKRVLTFMSAGIVLDMTATAFMIIGSPNSPLSFHGLLGYSSLTAMIIEVILIWRYHLQAPNQEVKKTLHLYSRYAYIWWVLVFITGGILVILK